MSGSNQLDINRDAVNSKTSTVNKRPPIPPLFPFHNSSRIGVLSDKSENVLANSFTEFKRTMAQVKLNTLKSIKSNGMPTTREACIDYALDMVINNLILNGNLDPEKAQKMRTPLMKSQIATICAKMISQQRSSSQFFRLTKKNPTGKTPKPWSLRKQEQQLQKWVIQEAAQPGSVQSIPKKTKSATATRKEKGEGLSQDSLTLSNGSEKCKKTTVSKSAKTSKKSPNHSPKLKRSLQVLPAQSDAKLANLLNTKSLQSHDCTPLQSCSGTPSSNQSLQHNSGVLANHKFVQTIPSISTELATDLQKNSEQCVPSTAAEISRGVETIKRKDPHQHNSELDKFFSNSNLNLTGESKCSTQAPSGLSMKNGYQILVDMTGFRNEDISMEVLVESRQLIFLALRPKREKLNYRRVTEIVDVPSEVNMENLKIGRQVDGFVLVEQRSNSTMHKME